MASILCSEVSHSFMANLFSWPLDTLHFLDTPSGSDFKLDAFLVAPCETFEPHYGNYYFLCM